MTILILVIVIVIFLVYSKKKREYNKSNYKKESGNKFWQVFRQKGNYGEYLTFKMLEKIKGNNKILTNLYIPKGNGETTEVDIIFIHETGIYILESKNYSGWIFGNEDYKNWIQSLPSGYKNNFYNPIWQNNTHIKYVAKVLKLNKIYFQSIIVFSQRCTLKKIEVYSENISVIKRDKLRKTLKKIIKNYEVIFTMEEINIMYESLKPYTCVSKKIKKIHIKNIEEKQNQNQKKKLFW